MENVLYISSAVLLLFIGVGNSFAEDIRDRKDCKTVAGIQQTASGDAQLLLDGFCSRAVSFSEKTNPADPTPTTKLVMDPESLQVGAQYYLRLPTDHPTLPGQIVRVERTR